MKIRILAEFPMPIVFGGLELQCLRTFKSLKVKLKDVSLLDYHNKDDTFNILHIFGNPAGLYEICYHASKSHKIVISAVCGATGYPNKSIKSIIRKRLLSIIAKCSHQQTDYNRLRFMFQSAAHIICLNELERQSIAVNYGISISKTTIISNGVEKQYFSATPDRFVEKYGVKDFVLYTGNIVERKNPLKLARVLKSLGIKGVFIGSVFIAELEYAAWFEEVIASSPNLLWIRGLPHDDPVLVSAYAASSIFCMPSSAETQSLSALEAMATGTPIILGDFPYAYQPPFENAVRCNPGDERSIEKCIRQILEAPDKYMQKLANNFTWENVAAEVMKVYERVLKS